jgi:hypothetical protein
MRFRCPHAKSDMTPCYMRDGEVTLIVMVPQSGGKTEERLPLHCVGCERSRELLDIEKKRIRRGGTGC